MQELIERYIFDVTRRLPEKERDEVKRELSASIFDMLPDNPDEQQIMDALTRLGAPAQLAEQYRQRPRYLISPALFESYILALKQVTAVVAAIFAGIGAFTTVFAGNTAFDSIVSATVSAAVEGALQAAFWVTFGFAMAERYDRKQKPWTIAELPRLPDTRGVAIPRVSSLVGMILSVFFTALMVSMIVRDEWLFVLAHNTMVINPFSQAAMHRAIPYILLSGGMALIMNGCKLYWAKWNIPLCVINILYNLAWVSIAIYMLQWPDLFSDTFIAFTNTLNGSADMLRYIQSGEAILFFSVALAIAAASDIVAAAVNTFKGFREAV